MSSPITFSRATFKRASGYVLHRGTVNGAPFVAIATATGARRTHNRKTGDMVQVWFLLENVNPVDAVATGEDARTICNGCPFAAGKGCYVNVGQAPLSVWKAYHRGVYPNLDPKNYAAVFAGRKVRFGAYGNPSLLPLAMVRAIAAASDGWTGYFHDWKTNPYARSYSRFFMASTETDESLQCATAKGFRVFHVSPVQPAGTVECLSDATDGRVACADCKLACNGRTGGAAGARSVWINPHGSKANRAAAVATGAIF